MMNLAKRFAVSVIGASAGLLLYCGSFYIKCLIENRQVQSTYEVIKADCVEETSKSDKIPREEQEAEIIKESFGVSWEKLAEINPQIVAWIDIPGADISYPVVQGEDDEYYLRHSITGEEDPFGSIFLAKVNEKEFLDSHSFVYGHNMEGNMMFANLNRYENREFLESCPQFFIITPRRKFCYEIFSVEQAAEGSACFEYGYEVGSPEYTRQLRSLKEHSIYDTGVEPDGEQPMATLITCNSRLDDNVRMAVHGICRKMITDSSRE